MKLHDLFEGATRPKPSDNEIVKFFSYFSDIATMTDNDIGILFNEEFSDCFSDDEINQGLLDAAIQHAVDLVHSYRE